MTHEADRSTEIPIPGAGEGDGFAYVLEPADPGDRALDAESEPEMRHASVHRSTRPD